jgi:hypothetical protein
MRSALVALTLLLVATSAQAASKKGADKKVPAPAAAPVAAPDPSLPVITHAPLETAVRDRDLTITAQIADPEGVFGAMVYVRSAGDEKYAPYPLDTKDEHTFTARVPALRITKDIEYYLEAFDAVGNGPATVGTAQVPLRVATTEAPPEAPPEVASTVIDPPVAPLNVPALATAGGGVVLVAIGAVLYLGASSTVKEIDAKYAAAGAPRLPTDAADTHAAISKSRVGSVLMIAGGIAAVGGATWFFLPTGGGAGGDVGLAVTGRF